MRAYVFTSGYVLRVRAKALKPGSTFNKELAMKDERELVLKATKEIVVKFIEVGRLSVSSFSETWQHIFSTIQASLEKAPKRQDDSPQ